MGRSNNEFRVKLEFEEMPFLDTKVRGKKAFDETMQLVYQKMFGERRK